MRKVLQFALSHLTEGLMIALISCLIAINGHIWSDVNGRGGIEERLREVEKIQAQRSGDKEAIRRALDAHAKAVAEQVNTICEMVDQRFNTMEGLIGTMISALQSKGVSVGSAAPQLQEDFDHGLSGSNE